MWITHARIVLSDQVLEDGSLRLEDGVIAEIRDRPVSAEAINAHGFTLLPGLVDLHGDMIERELEPRPGTRFDAELALIELDKRLARCGVTTAYASMSFADGLGIRSDGRALDIIEELIRRRDELLVDHRVHARYEVSNTAAQPGLIRLVRAGSLDLLSLMDHTPGQGQYRNMETYVSYLAKWLGRDAESVRELAQARMDGGGAEAWALAAELGQTARRQGVAVASHDDDTPEKVALVEGMGATISEFPVTLEAAQAAHSRGLKVVMGAPNALRGASHSGNLSALEAFSAGAMDALASDYSPMSMLQAAWRLVHEGRCSLPHAAALVSDIPAAAAGLNDRGRLEVGRRADLTLVEDRERPRVRLTFCRGRPVFHDGSLNAPQPARFL